MPNYMDKQVDVPTIKSSNSTTIIIIGIFATLCIAILISISALVTWFVIRNNNDDNNSQTPTPNPNPNPNPDPIPNPNPNPNPTPNPNPGQVVNCDYDANDKTTISQAQLAIFANTRGTYKLASTARPFETIRTDDLDTRPGYNSIGLIIDGGTKTCNKLDLTDPNKFIIKDAFNGKPIELVSNIQLNYDGMSYLMARDSS